jgi:hypothetical protein
VRVVVLTADGMKTEQGATVRMKRLTGPPSVQTRVVDGGSGYLTQSEYTVHFGTDPTATYAIEVSFPSHPNARVIVDSTNVAWLGHVVPLSLGGRTITVRRNGTAILSTPSSPLDATLPDETPAFPTLHPPMPNPARGATTLSFRLPAVTAVTLTIHDVTGRRVRSAVLGTLAAGERQWTWDGRDDNGRSVPSGVYLTRMMIGGRTVAERRIVELN